MANGTLKVGTITTSSGSGTITLGQSGETITIPTGVTVGGLMSNTPIFEATKSATQSFANNTTVKITFDGTNIDTDNAFNTTDSTFVVPAGKAGKYYIAGNVDMPGCDDGELVQLQMNKNNSLIQQSLEREHASAGNQGKKVRVSVILDLAVGDAIDFRCFQNSGGAQNIDQTETFFRGFRLIGA